MNSQINKIKFLKQEDSLHKAKEMWKAVLRRLESTESVQESPERENIATKFHITFKHVIVFLLAFW